MSRRLALSLAGLSLAGLAAGGCGPAAAPHPAPLAYRWPAGPRQYTYNLDAVLTAPANGQGSTTYDLAARFRAAVAPLGHGLARLTLDLLNGEASRNGQALGGIVPAAGLSVSVILNRHGLPAGSGQPAPSGAWSPLVVPALPARPWQGALQWSRTDTLTLPDGARLTVVEHNRLTPGGGGQLDLRVSGSGTLSGPGLPAPETATLDGITVLSAGTHLPLSSRWTARGYGPGGQAVRLRITLTRDNP
ncbi:exported protein of unknown function [Candidatus Hydrogenisulfobacillus filiaventi]|uniref:Uncharacterized protein n=1 Tax=Candidatus Hydrogenisulfobacillus filiaventi TaxID=2707344 RepID=A0A6F8ZD29_9FIRM|nr:exported protein of unknown function [Candidatus Hydrogenisulfobacillus filiaventi]